jgi:C6 transcription factor Pro1
MYRKCSDIKLEQFGLAEKSRKILCEDLPLSEYEPAVAEEVMTFRFLGGTIIWLDIICSITAGTAPHLLAYHFSVITADSQTKLEDIMGCKTWTVLQIGRIASLHYHQTQAKKQGHFDCTEFDQNVEDIGREIQYDIIHGAWDSLEVSETDPALAFRKSSAPPRLVTLIFSYMASVYLHLVIHGYQKLDLLDSIVSKAMRVLQNQIPSNHLPALVPALYVIGSVAKQRDEQFFRTIFSSLPLMDSSLKHRGKILLILEEIWSRRLTRPDFAWKDSLDLTQDILLI